MNKHKKSLSASLLRIILFVSLFTIITVAVVGFVFGRGILEKYAVEVSHKRIDANSSNSSISDLKKINKELAANQDVVAKANSLKATIELPQFKIIDDINQLAANNNISISSIDFTDTAQAAANTAAPAAGAALPQQQVSGAPVSSSGTTIAVTVTLGASVDYTNLLQFIYDVEQNVPKLQIKSVALSAADSGSQVVSQPLVIEMHTR